jgi:uncharacterized protein YajQ (UPF0234 family)
MASKNCSFDIAAITDLAEVQNAVNQAMMEIKQRYDFKNSKSTITLETKENQVVLIGDNDSKLNSVTDVLQSKLIKRKKGKEIVKFIKDLKLKVQSQITDDTVRVSGKNRDDLQDVITRLKDKEFDIAMTFTNYR